MLSYTGKRLLQTIFVLLGISLITFVLLQVVPGDPVALMLEKRADPETIAKVRKELGLDLPYYVQYLNFIKGAIHLDFGTSYFTKEVVTDALIRCFKVTVKLACMSFIFASVIGIPCGIFAAVKRGKGIDTVVMVLSIVGVSAPAFWVAIILQILFGLKLNVLPISGYAGILHTSESCAGCALRRKYCANHQNQYAGSTGTGLHPYREGKGCHALGRYLEARPEKCHDPDRNSRRYRFWLHADRIHADRKGILHSGNR